MRYQAPEARPQPHFPKTLAMFSSSAIPHPSNFNTQILASEAGKKKRFSSKISKP
jgi:hypothetical protein